MSKIFAIITFNDPKFREEAAEAWKEDQVTALGWSRTGDLSKIDTFEKLSAKIGAGSRGPASLWKFLKEVKKGDLILAYATKNVVAYVGEVVGQYEFNKKNTVGKSSEKGGFGYSHQRRVKWWPKPHYFSRTALPMDVARQMGLQGGIIVEINPGHLGPEGFRDYLKDNANKLTDTSLNLNEDTIKAGIRKYLHNNIPLLENGLRITQVEHGINDQKRPDFIARDLKGNKVLIECKGVADEKAIRQAKGYLQKFKKEPGTRAMVIAFRATLNSRRLAKKHNIELYECDLAFNKIDCS